MTEVCFAAWGNFRDTHGIGDLFCDASNTLADIGFQVTHVGVDLPDFSNSRLLSVLRVEKRIKALRADISKIEGRSSLELVSSPSKDEPTLRWTAYASFVWKKQQQLVLATQDTEEKFRKSTNFFLVQIKKDKLTRDVDAIAEEIGEFSHRCMDVQKKEIFLSDDSGMQLSSAYVRGNNWATTDALVKSKKIEVLHASSS